MAVKKINKLPTVRTFLLHLSRNLLMGLFFIAVALFVGMLGYHSLQEMSWADAFINASMILSGMGPVTTMTSTAGKIFAGCYALFSGLAFIAIMALIFAPIIHRFFHKIHLKG
ncbi:MAG: hypothetical protein P4M12_03785 [Gammaproteobacteria bacterium]|nr:hypothetical protein [Gammaproteobacteria bacterium]